MNIGVMLLCRIKLFDYVNYVLNKTVTYLYLEMKINLINVDVTITFEENFYYAIELNKILIKVS